MRTRRLCIALFLGLLLLACEPGVEQGGTPPDEPPPTAKVESALIESAGDDLFPVADGQDVVCMRLSEKSQVGQLPQNCTSCPQCEGCFWDILYADMGTGEQRVLETVERLNSSPRLSGGRAYWMVYDSGKRKIVIWDLDTNKRAVFTASNNWYGLIPVLYGDHLYWQGYDNASHKQGLHRTHIHSGANEFLFSAQFRDLNFMDGNGLTQLNRQVPAIITPDAIYWITSLGPGRSIRMWRFDDKKETILVQKDTGELFGLAAGYGFIAWKETDQYGNCWNADECKVSLKAHIFGEGPVDLTPANGQVSRYGRVSVSIDRVYWADYRYGPYALFGRDIYNPQEVELRYTSEDAVVGSATHPVVSSSHLIWMDRRHSKWDVFKRPL